MKKIIFLLITAVLFISACGGSVQQGPENSEKQTESDSKESDKGVTAEDAAKTALKVGDKMPAFELKNAKGDIVKSDDLLKENNLVLVFYRGGWCPFCNTYLKELQENLKPINERNAALVAVSPEKPDNSLSTTEKNELMFEVLSDDKLKFSRKMGLVFELSAETDRKYQENGVKLVESNGTDKPELPIPATYIVGKDGVIKYAFIDPDYKKRFRPKELLAELDKVKGE